MAGRDEKLLRKTFVVGYSDISVKTGIVSREFQGPAFCRVRPRIRATRLDFFAKKIALFFFAYAFHQRMPLPMTTLERHLQTTATPRPPRARGPSESYK